MRIVRIAICVLVSCVLTARAEDEFERPPIEYSQATPENAVSRLQSRLGQGEISLPFDPARGYLPGLLQALRIPVASQTLVFSKTSMQRQRITARTPRAIYFNDEVYVGYCQSGEVLEVSVADPNLGAVFYTLEQQPALSAETPPALKRQTQNCLLCHHSSQSGDVPSHLLRSVFADASGLPLFSEGSHRIDHTTPLEDRWGGWYVTGTHGAQAHLGNLIVRNSPVQRPIKNDKGHNVVDLRDRLPLENYLSPHSDIVALLVLEHQTMVHNLLTQANFATRQALDYEAKVNRDFGDPADHRLESTTRRIASAGDKLVRGLLFVKEAPIRAPIAGTSGFAQEFSKRGPCDGRGRSLRDFDLHTRTFKYPCSYLVYSAAFDALPGEMKVYVADRLRSILAAAPADLSDESRTDAQDFAHLTTDDRIAIREILEETKPEVLAPRS